MPKANDAKTESALKYARAFILLSIILIAVGVIILIGRNSPPVLQVGDHAYTLEVATTTIAQQRGLSGRPTMATNQGMLFSFTDSAVRCFWMKDMHFSLDMLWLNSQKQVIHIEPEVSPKTYPKVFCPSQPAQYVIEIDAGQAKVAGITTGQTLNF